MSNADPIPFPAPVIDRSRIKAWRVDGTDIIAAETAEEAILYHSSQHGIALVELEDQAVEVNLASTMRADEETDAVVTLAQLIAECPRFPYVIASSEH